MRRDAWWHKVGALFLATGVAACESGVSPLRVDAPPPVTHIDVAGVAPDADFRTTGEIVLGLVPRARDGSAVLSGDVSVPIDVREPACHGVEEGTTEIVETGDAPLAATLILDSSGSLAETDPERLRVDAARTFAEAVWRGGPENEVALFDFGAGREVPFADSRLLTGFTRDPSALESGLQRITADANTPLYESVIEVLEYVHQRRGPGNYQRIAVVVSDGLPNGPRATLEDAITTAGRLEIPVYTIGLGTASIASPIEVDSAVQVMQQLAGRTEGKYAAADDPATLASLQGAIGTAISEGHLNKRLRIVPVPSPGTTLRLSVGGAGGGEVVTFRSPAQKPSDAFFTWPLLPFAPDGEFRADCITQNGDCYYLGDAQSGWDAQPYQQEEDSNLGWHLGADWNRGSGDDDLGAAVYSTANGTVTRTDDIGGDWGKAIFVRHQTGFGTFTSVYAHVEWCDSGPPAEGAAVVAGQQIAKVGKVTSLPPHLHFEVRAGASSDIGRGYTQAPLTGVSQSLRSEAECGIGPEGQINPNYFVSRHNGDARVPLYSWCAGGWEPAWLVQDRNPDDDRKTSSRYSEGPGDS